MSSDEDNSATLQSDEEEELDEETIEEEDEYSDEEYEFSEVEFESSSESESEKMSAKELLQKQLSGLKKSPRSIPDSTTRLKQEAREKRFSWGRTKLKKGGIHGFEVDNSQPDDEAAKADATPGWRSVLKKTPRDGAPGQPEGMAVATTAAEASKPAWMTQLKKSAPAKLPPLDLNKAKANTSAATSTGAEVPNWLANLKKTPRSMPALDIGSAQQSSSVSSEGASANTEPHRAVQLKKTPRDGMISLPSL